MATVMIRCPRTGSAISTEINTEATVFERLPAVMARLQCPVCGEEHTWTANDAWLADNPLIAQPEKVPAIEK
jgi:hypothetical protein